MKPMSKWLGVVLAGWVGLAFGEVATPPNVADLEALRSESALLKERLNNLRLRMDMENLAGGNSSGTSVGGDTVSSIRIAQVAGLEGHYRATLVWPNGETFTGASGSRVNSHWLIQSVAIDRVTLKGEHGVVSVPFQGAGEASQQGTAIQPTTPAQVPPMPVGRVRP